MGIIYCEFIKDFNIKALGIKEILIGHVQAFPVQPFKIVRINTELIYNCHKTRNY